MNWVLWCAEEMSTFCKTEVSTVSCSSSGLIFILSNVLRDRTRLDHLVNFPINFNHEWWEPALPLGDDRSQSHYATKNQYSSKIYESFYLEPGAKNIDDHAGHVLFDLGLSGTMGSIMITMKSTLGLSGTSLVGLLRKGAQKIPGFMLVNLIPNTWKSHFST